MNINSTPFIFGGQEIGRLSRTLNGMPIFVNDLIEDTPRVGISSSFQDCTDEFRRNFNREMGELFGVTPNVISIGDRLLMNSRTYNLLRAKCEVNEKFLSSAPNNRSEPEKE